MISLQVALSAAAAVLVFLQAGCLALRLARRPDDRLAIGEWLALSYGVGIGLVTTQMLLFSLGGIRFTAERIVLPWVVAWVLHLARLRRRHVDGTTTTASAAQPANSGPGRWCPTAAAFVLLTPIILTCSVMLFRATFMPVWVWDSWAIWDLKARAFFHHGSVVPFVSDTYYALSHLDYPVLYPLAGSFLYLVLGSPHAIVQIIPVLFYAVTLTICFGVLRRLGSSQVTAAALTAGLAFLPNLLQWSQHYQAESAQVFYTLTFTSYLYLYAREPRRWYLLAAALAAGFLTQVRPEGWLLVLPGVLLLSSRLAFAPDAVARRSAGVATATFVLVCGAIYLPWWGVSRFVAKTSGGVSQVNPGQILAGVHLIPDVVLTTLQWMADRTFMDGYALLFPLTLVLVLMNWRRYVRPSGESFLLVAAVCSVLPHGIHLITQPYWLSAEAMGRYLIVLTVSVYFMFALHTVEAAASPARGTGRPVAVKVAAALAAAFVLLSVPVALPKIHGRTLSWDFRNGPQGWNEGQDRPLRMAGQAVGPLGTDTWIVTPPVRVDGDLTRTVRIVARGVRDGVSRLTLSWKRLGGEYQSNQNVWTDVTWSGVYQTIVFRPHWGGIVEEFRLEAGGGKPTVYVQSVGSEPRWLSMLGLTLRAQRANLSALIALALVFLAAVGVLSTRDAVQRSLACGFAVIVVALWLVPDASPVLADPSRGGDHVRPISLTRKVFDYWARLGGLGPHERLERLEAESGWPHIEPVISATATQCGSRGDVVVFAPPGNGAVQHGGYVFQRSSYRLYPSKVVLAHQPAQLAELLRQKGPFTALIVYGTQAPGDVGGGMVYRSEQHFTVVCDPHPLGPK